MHVPDGFIDAPVSVAAGVFAAGAVAVSLARRAAHWMNAPPRSPGFCRAPAGPRPPRRSSPARPPHHLSFGQRRRVAVATVLAMDPEILVQPGPASRRELADIPRSLDITALMVTHDLPYALELCPRAVILSEGVIAADDRTQELLRDEGLVRSHRLELPFGFDPGAVDVPTP
ncbi:hypothetical protein GCM10010253_46490 [Streptomyces badius]|uniref:Cobalt ABC transporter ATP-binding protein n=1 Tax=Streptomyces badius TaxID=1941 RepID=A0ABQ2TEE3_STRBA|nr:hypothetical protein GCM10010253_46490 [Streptomyces badius]